MTQLRYQIAPGEAPTCRGKTRYATFTEAKRKARKARMRHDQALAPYHCIECGGYHYGNRPMTVARAVPKRRDRFYAEDEE